MADGFLETEEQEAKRVKKWVKRMEFVEKASYGYPTKCPCGERLIKETTNERTYLTCKAFKTDGLHVRKTWEQAIDEEVRSLKLENEDQIEARIRSGGSHENLLTEMRKELENNTKEIAKLKELVGKLVGRI